MVGQANIKAVFSDFFLTNKFLFLCIMMLMSVMYVCILCISYEAHMNKKDSKINKKQTDTQTNRQTDRQTNIQVDRLN